MDIPRDNSLENLVVSTDPDVAASHEFEKIFPEAATVFLMLETERPVFRRATHRSREARIGTRRHRWDQRLFHGHRLATQPTRRGFARRRSRGLSRDCRGERFLPPPGSRRRQLPRHRPRARCARARDPGRAPGSGQRDRLRGPRVVRVHRPRPPGRTPVDRRLARTRNRRIDPQVLPALRGVRDQPGPRALPLVAGAGGDSDFARCRGLVGDGLCRPGRARIHHRLVPRAPDPAGHRHGEPGLSPLTLCRPTCRCGSGDPPHAGPGQQVHRGLGVGLCGRRRFCRAHGLQHPTDSRARESGPPGGCSWVGSSVSRSIRRFKPSSARPPDVSGRWRAPGSFAPPMSSHAGRTAGGGRWCSPPRRWPSPV